MPEHFAEMDMIDDLKIGRDDSHGEQRAGEAVGSGGAELATTRAGLMAVRSTERRQDRHKARDDNGCRQAKVGVVAVERRVHQDFGLSFTRTELWKKFENAPRRERRRPLEWTEHGPNRGFSETLG